MMESYLTSTKNLPQIFRAIKNARPPDRFTLKFLEDIGFKTSSDRLLVAVLKGLGFLDANGAPTEMYMRFLDDTQSKYVLAEGIKKAYNELFQVNLKAQDMSANDLKNKFKTMFSGQKTEDALYRMTTTFKALCGLADFSNTDVVKQPEETKREEPKANNFFNTNNFNDPNLIPLVQKHINTELHYNIQIHLPETRDLAVYDAIFKSLKEHLL